MIGCLVLILVTNHGHRMQYAGGRSNASLISTLQRSPKHFFINLPQPPHLHEDHNQAQWSSITYAAWLFLRAGHVSRLPRRTYWELARTTSTPEVEFGVSSIPYHVSAQTAPPSALQHQRLVPLTRRCRQGTLLTQPSVYSVVRHRPEDLPGLTISASSTHASMVTD